MLFALSLPLLLRLGPCPSLPWPGILPHLPLLIRPPPLYFGQLLSGLAEAIVSRLAMTLQVTGYQGRRDHSVGVSAGKGMFAFSFVFPPDYSGADLARISKNQKGKSPPLGGGWGGSHEVVS